MIAINIYLLKEKTAIKIIYQEVTQENLNVENFEHQYLDGKEIDSRIEYYLDLENQGIKNLNLYLNLSVLNQEKDPTLAEYYLEKAKEIDPNNKIFK